MTSASLDLMTLYAYADSAHAEERESWREFLGFLLPVLLQMDKDDVEHLLNEAISPSAESVSSTVPHDHEILHIMRGVSGEIAEALGLEREFGVAAFVEGHFPSRVYPIRRNKNKLESGGTSKWVAQFARIQKDPDFEGHFSEWRSRLDEALAELEDLPESA